jgi:hypothetical protein
VCERAWNISVVPGATFLWGARGKVGIRYLRVFGLLFKHTFFPLGPSSSLACDAELLYSVFST